MRDKECCDLCQAIKSLLNSPLRPGYEVLELVCPKCGTEIGVVVRTDKVCKRAEQTE